MTLSCVLWWHGARFDGLEYITNFCHIFKMYLNVAHKYCTTLGILWRERTLCYLLCIKNVNIIERVSFLMQCNSPQIYQTQ